MYSLRYFHPFLAAVLFLAAVSCQARPQPEVRAAGEAPLYDNAGIQVGAERTDVYFPMLKGKRIGLVVNHTSLIGSVHLADTLLAAGLEVRAIFAPEHGFRGEADAGETVSDGKDIATGLPIYSLYGKNKKIAPEYLREIDLLIFDIQDVGARFYTYISTMHLVMEAAAENDKSVLVLDRPNPNGHYVDGPVLDTALRSFVSMHPIPIVHGMTVGELAGMINGEQWLSGGLQCDLTVVPCEGYDHAKFYELPVPPSPNLPNMRSVYLYPALCLFEGTDMSVGRGTNKQFQVLGSPRMSNDATPGYTFTPVSMPGAKSPKHEGLSCFGIDYTDMDVRSARTVRLAPVIYATIYAMHKDPANFFTPFFDKLAGSYALREAIEQRASSRVLEEIYRSGLEDFKVRRRQYLLYPDFE